MSQLSLEPIVFYDSHCGLCSRFVKRVIRWDKTQILKFAPLDGRTSESLVSPELRKLDTIVFLDEGRAWTRSDALVKILEKTAGGPKSSGKLLGMLPRKIRDFVYDRVARNRHRIGMEDRCELPKEPHRFLP